MGLIAWNGFRGAFLPVVLSGTLLASACSSSSISQASANAGAQLATATSEVPASVVPTLEPSPSAASVAPISTATPDSSTMAAQVQVANTQGQGVYIRNTPNLADRLRAYPEGTQLTIVGPDVDGD